MIPFFSTMAMEDLTSLLSDYGTLFREDTDFYNRIVLGTLLPHTVWAPLPHFFQTWLRNYLGGVLLYLLSGFMWCFYIYYWKRNVYLPKGFSFYLLFLPLLLILFCVISLCEHLGCVFYPNGWVYRKGLIKNPFFFFIKV